MTAKPHEVKLALSVIEDRVEQGTPPTLKQGRWLIGEVYGTHSEMNTGFLHRLAVENKRMHEQEAELRETIAAIESERDGEIDALVDARHKAIESESKALKDRWEHLKSAYTRLTNRCQPVEAVTEQLSEFVDIASGWLKELRKGNAMTTKEIEWYQGTRTGISSETIWSVMTGHPVRRHNVPLDPSDFNRCYQLLLLFPDWRPRLQEVADRFPEWQVFVDHWDELERLFLRDKATGSCQEMFDLMRQLR